MLINKCKLNISILKLYCIMYYVKYSPLNRFSVSIVFRIPLGELAACNAASSMHSESSRSLNRMKKCYR